MQAFICDAVFLLSVEVERHLAIVDKVEVQTDVDSLAAKTLQHDRDGGFEHICVCLWNSEGVEPMDKNLALCLQ